jgi:5,10-methylenetetrahydromethanopterin reductase
MKFGIQINRSTESVEEHLKIVELAEQAGFDPILFADGVSTAGVTHRDLYAMLVLWAQRVRRARIGTCVTNPVTRHPAVTANAICTIDELSGGRAILGLGTGDTPIFVLGLEPARLKALRESVETIQAFCAGRPFELNGRPVQSTWKRHIPILLAADGPKTLELAGEIADGVIVGSGIHPEVVEWAAERIKEGASRAGRAVPEVWINGICHIVDDPVEGRNFIRPRLITRVNHNFRYGTYAVPDAHLAEVQRLRAEYDETDVGPTSKNVRLITDYLVDRFSITGTVDQAVERLRTLAERGVERFMVATHYFKEHRIRTIESFGKIIIPALAGKG